MGNKLWTPQMMVTISSRFFILLGWKLDPGEVIGKQRDILGKRRNQVHSELVHLMLLVIWTLPQDACPSPADNCVTLRAAVVTRVRRAQGTEQQSGSTKAVC